MRKIAAFTALALLASSGVSAQQNGEDFATMMARINLLPDTQGDGPMPAITMIDPSLPDYVMYRPADLSKVQLNKLGVFIWGNGGCADNGTSSRFHLAEIASYGYLVIAPGAWRSGPNAVSPPAEQRAPGPGGQFPPSPTSAADLTAALDWALAENVRIGGPLYGLIDENALAVGGFSCGGVQALTIAGDPRLDTVVVQNSGLLPEGDRSLPGMDLPKSGLLALHTPVLYFDGGTTDIAYENGMDDFRRIEHVPAIMVNRPTGHGGSYHEPMGGRNASIVIDWLEWQLRGNMSAARTFIGANCRLCTDPEATIEAKNW